MNEEMIERKVNSPSICQALCSEIYMLCLIWFSSWDNKEKEGLREIQYFSQGQGANKWWDWDWGLGFPDSKAFTVFTALAEEERSIETDSN